MTIQIGEIRWIITPFFNTKTGKMDFKQRPALILAQADGGDYTALPISSISRKENRSPEYDIEIDPAQYPLLHLSTVSYVRTHKQTVVHTAEISNCVGNVKNDYGDLYLLILEKREQFSNEITEQALQ